MPSRRSCTPQS
uniref:Uncharacterized protein n=1 Tax=Anguilla anguilla TaxID=7936 RepID=A0A0E9T7L6_ANGAN